jgi:hypothetical protein
MQRLLIIEALTPRPSPVSSLVADQQRISP